MRRVHYAWVVAGVGFVTLITAAGFRSTPGVLIVPLQDEFGWTRATIGLAISVNLVFYGLGGPFAAGARSRSHVGGPFATGARSRSYVGGPLSTSIHGPPAYEADRHLLALSGIT